MDFGDIVNYVSTLSGIILDLRQARNVCVIRFEDLVERDHATVAKLRGFAGFDIDLELCDTSSDYDPQHAFWTPESGAPIRTSSLSKYRDELDAEQIALVTSMTEHFNSVFGYAPLVGSTE